MVVNAAGVDGSQVRDEQTGVERAEVDDPPGQQPVQIQMVKEPEHHPRQPRHREGEIGEPVRAVVVGGLAVAVDGLLHPLADGKHRVVRAEEYLQRRLVRRAVRPLFQQYKGKAEMVPAIDPAVDHKTVQLRIFQRGLVIRRRQHAHVRHAPALPPLLADVGPDDVLVDHVAGPVLRVVPPRHDIGQRLYDRRQIP